ncbi:MAG: hypothetical protein IH608_06225 [Proteobacteria bacterium]|nr:hypothetical protein [Pseudomonadota bacterium]
MRRGGEGRTAWIGLLAMAVAVAGIGVSLGGRSLGYPFLETYVGPGVTLAGAALWVGYRARKGRRR